MVISLSLYNGGIRSCNFISHSIPAEYVWVSHFQSMESVLHGVHFGSEPPASKLMSATRGATFLIAGRQRDHDRVGGFTELNEWP